MRIGVFGGTFDPVHRGHLVVSEAAGRALQLDQIRLIPTAVQPFKRDVAVSDARHRLAMLSAAVLGRDQFVVDDREIRRGGVSYTAETLESLHADFPEDELFLMVGADVAASLSEWHRAEDVAELCQIVVLNRAGVPAVGGAFEQVEVPAIDISSTAVREAFRAGENTNDTVPDAVAAYIIEHGLYQ